jgi:DNA-binding Lrp family transcriptional regulator
MITGMRSTHLSRCRRWAPVQADQGPGESSAIKAAIPDPKSPPPTACRLADLRASGALYFDVDFHFRSLGVISQTMLWLSVAPDQMVAAGRALAAHPEVPFAAATTGSTNLFASVLCPDPSALYTYLTTKVATLPSVQQMETAPVCKGI